MLFNSGEFCFIFLPVTLLLFYAAAHWRLTRLAIWILGVASAIFYVYGTPVVPGPWGIPVPPYLLLLFASIVGNYFIGAQLRHRRSRLGLALGVAANLAVLGYFKYANFFVHNLNAVTGLGLAWPKIFLPLGISFYTFQSIAYLADCKQGKVGKHSMLDFAVFLHFFPQLIAGPIVHHREMLPQFRSLRMFVVNHRNLATGFALFTLGLAKKVLIADHFSDWVGPSFLHVEQLSASGAWAAVLSFGFQLYFDFSGYTDMAIGLGLLFNVRYPQNFNSPYKAESLIDFWRRWHMTLSRFLRDYVYIPLGGKSPREVAPLRESFGHDVAGRFLAWCGVDVCDLGRMARVLSGLEPRVGGSGLEAAARGGKAVDAGRGLSRLGFFPQPEFARRADADSHDAGGNSPGPRGGERNGIDVAGGCFSGRAFRAQFVGDRFPAEAEADLGLEYCPALPARGLSFRCNDGISLLPILSHGLISNFKQAMAVPEPALFESVGVPGDFSSRDVVWIYAHAFSSGDGRLETDGLSGWAGRLQSEVTGGGTKI